MKPSTKSSAVAASILMAFAIHADNISHAADARSISVADIFESEGVAGTLVVATADGSILYVHDDEKSRMRYSPASTFKIPNTLIALDTAVVTSADSPFKWDGADKGSAAWNHDQTLQTAFAVSCVWCYQEIARNIGARHYASELAALGYGNQQIGQHVDQFWLNGDLQISAMEQIDFLKKLYDYSLPYQRGHIDTVKSIMLEEQTDDYRLYAKSGWTGPRLHVGWYVGFIEKDASTWLFAMNFSMADAGQAGLRKALTIRSLQALGIL
jgi:beta-lactamase class D